MSLLDDVANDVEEALKTIEDLEIFKSKVYILTRVWSERKGRGTPVDTVTKVEPNPYIADFSHSARIREGGSTKQGDLFIKYIPKRLLDKETLINLKTDNELIESFYMIDDELYEIISIVKGFAYWNIQLRKTNKKKVSI